MSTPVSFSAENQELNTAATSCTTTASTVDSKLAAIRSWVEDLGTQWIGMAPAQFAQLMADFDLCSKDLNQALNGIAAGLRTNAGNYSASDTANARSISSLSGDLPSINL